MQRTLHDNNDVLVAVVAGIQAMEQVAPNHARTFSSASAVKGAQIQQVKV